jgi:hypothetical protein
VGHPDQGDVPLEVFGDELWAVVRDDLGPGAVVSAGGAHPPLPGVALPATEAEPGQEALDQQARAAGPPLDETHHLISELRAHPAALQPPPPSLYSARTPPSPRPGPRSCGLARAGLHPGASSTG